MHFRHGKSAANASPIWRIDFYFYFFIFSINEIYIRALSHYGRVLARGLPNSPTGREKMKHAPFFRHKRRIALALGEYSRCTRISSHFLRVRTNRIANRCERAHKFILTSIRISIRRSVTEAGLPVLDVFYTNIFDNWRSNAKLGNAA